MKEAVLDVETRNLGTKSILSSLRKSGKVPAVFYGKGMQPQNIAVTSKLFMTILEKNGSNAIIDLNFSDGKKSAIVRDLQRDIITQEPIHIDFLFVSPENKIEVSVPIHIDGVPDGVKNFGGVMEIVLREVKISALPKSIPQRIDIDVSPLEIGQGITIADLPKLDGVDYIQELSSLVLHVVNVRAEEEKPAEGAAEVAQPEVISKGKKDKEGEEGAAVSTAAGGTKK
jgi:large subunit ribosomal protein L25